MRFTVQTSDIVYALSTVGRAVSSRPTHPIMEGIMLKASGNSVTLTATDGNMTIRTGVPAMVDTDGAAVLPGRIVSELARKLPGAETTFSVDGTRAGIRSGTSRTTVSVMSTEDFPEPPTVAPKHAMTAPQNAMKEAIAKASFAVSTDESRVVLTGLYLDASPDDVRVVALDGFRLACSAVPGGECDDAFTCVIPGRAMTELGRLLTGTDAMCGLRFDSTLMEARVGDTSLYTTLLAGAFPDYRRIIPDAFKTAATVKRSAMADAIERAGIMARNAHNGLIRLTVGGNSVSVASRDEIGQIEETVDAETTGPALDIAFNVRYLSDVLRALTDDTVTFNLNSATSPCVILPGEGHGSLHMVLPVRTMG